MSKHVALIKYIYASCADCQFMININVKGDTNITVKAALKFGSEAWVLKKREEQHRSSTD